jgi:uncharacterized protein (DUF697 family)
MNETCEQRALKWVRSYAWGGAAVATVPLAGTSAALAGIETHLVITIGKIYGETLTVKEAIAVAGTLGLASLGLKALAMEAANFVPVAGWLLKGSIAMSAITAMGHVVIGHYEKKHPGKPYLVDAAVEQALDRRTEEPR